MTLTFTKQGKVWVATATLTKPEPLDVDLVDAGNFVIFEKYSNDASIDYKVVKGNQFEHDKSFAAVLASAIYPTYVKFVSTRQVVKATLG